MRASYFGLTLAIAAGLFGPAKGEEYPARPVTLIVPYAPGGTTDVYSRAVANALTARLGQSFIVENRAGAGGAVGAEYLRNSRPDGYTIGFLSSATMLAINFQGKEFRAGQELDTVASFQTSTMLIAVNAGRIPSKSLKEFIEYLKAHPGMTYSTSGVGSVSHLSTEAFAKGVGAQVEHVGYRGSAPAMQALVSGEIDFGNGADRMSAGEFIKQGKIRALATTGRERATLFPDVPTVAEVGFPELEAEAFGGIFVPHGVPKPIVRKLADTIKEITADPSFKNELVRTGAEITFLGPEDFERSMNAEIDRYSKIVKDLSISLK
jgi:tripartite-type tricarboxylate transporter receptor subunit TctC